MHETDLRASAKISRRVSERTPTRLPGTPVTYFTRSWASVPWTAPCEKADAGTLGAASSADRRTRERCLLAGPPSGARHPAVLHHRHPRQRWTRDRPLDRGRDHVDLGRVGLPAVRRRRMARRPGDRGPPRDALRRPRYRARPRPAGRPGRCGHPRSRRARGARRVGVGSWREPGSSFGTEGVVDTISYLAFAAPIAYFIVMLRSP